jgi:hypothetical protein
MSHHVWVSKDRLVLRNHGVWGCWGFGGCGGVGGVGVWGHSLRSTFHRLHLLRLWTPTILLYYQSLFSNRKQPANSTVTAARVNLGKMLGLPKSCMQESQFENRPLMPFENLPLLQLCVQFGILTQQKGHCCIIDSQTQSTQSTYKRSCSHCNAVAGYQTACLRTVAG